MNPKLAVSASILIWTAFFTSCGSGSSTGTSPSTYTVGGSVAGLAGVGLVLQNNNGNNLVIGGNGTFTFSSAVSAGDAYTVTILLEPSSPAQTCTVTNGNGTANASVSNVQVSCVTPQVCGGVGSMTVGATTWLPQWCQEFSGAANLPDSTVWSFDLGGGGWGNNEVEVYCGPPGYAGNPAGCPTTFSTSTNTVYLDGGGHLVIQPLNSNGTWLSTRMKTQGLKDFGYGLIEASIQLPDTTNQGLWPAFWSLGSSYPQTPWPNCGEADFMENWSPQIYSGPGPGGNRATIHTALTDGAGVGKAYTFANGAKADTAFHKYGIIWSANMMEFYVDDPTAPFYIATPSDLPQGDTWPFNANIFLILNVAVGGNLGGATAALANPPQPMLVDYVRAFTAASSGAAVPAQFALQRKPAPLILRAGESGSRTFVSEFPSGASGFVYLSCGVDAPGATCGVTTTNHLNRHVVDARGGDSVTVTVSTSGIAGGAVAGGEHAVTIYAFMDSNRGSGADSRLVLPLTVMRN